MQFRRVKEEEWRNLQSSAYAHDEIRNRVSKLVDWLGTLFNDKTVGGVSGLRFERGTASEVPCEITTPCGSARLVLDWAMHDGALHAVLSLERKRRHENDDVRWEKVSHFYISERDKVFVETPSDGFYLRFGAGRQLENEVFEIGMGIFFAIVSGPVVK